MGLGSLSPPYAISLFFAFQHVLCYQRLALLKVETMDISKLFFHSKPLIKHLIGFSEISLFVSSSICLHIKLSIRIKIPMSFSISSP